MGGRLLRPAGGSGVGVDRTSAPSCAVAFGWRVAVSSWHAPIAADPPEWSRSPERRRFGRAYANADLSRSTNSATRPRSARGAASSLASQGTSAEVPRCRANKCSWKWATPVPMTAANTNFGSSASPNAAASRERSTAVDASHVEHRLGRLTKPGPQRRPPPVPRLRGRLPLLAGRALVCDRVEDPNFGCRHRQRPPPQGARRLDYWRLPPSAQTPSRVGPTPSRRFDPIGLEAGSDMPVEV